MKQLLRLNKTNHWAFIWGMLVFSVVTFTSHTHAQEVLSVGRSYRSLALGNTGVASATDSSALYYNPAILANVEGWWFDYAAWTIEISEGFTTLEAGLMLADLNLPYINRNGINDVTKIAFLEKENPYLRANAGMHISANLIKKGFTIAGSYLLEAVYTTKIVDNVQYIYQRDDTIQKVGLSIPIGVGQLVVGLAASNINRRIALDATTDSVPSWSDNYIGTGYDIGILYRMANAAKITWGLVIQNYGGVTYGDSTIEDPEQMALGVSMNHDLGLIRLFPAIDIRQINAKSGKTNTVHAGMEVGIFPNSTGGSYLTYRVGYNQGHATQGAELNFFNHSMILGVTQYSEEVGQDSETLANKRTILYFSMGF